MPSPLISPWLQTAGWALLHALWIGVLVVLGFEIILWAGRRGAARVRYAAALVALAAVVALPALVAWQIGPEWREHAACWRAVDGGRDPGPGCAYHGIRDAHSQAAEADSERAKKARSSITLALRQWSLFAMPAAELLGTLWLLGALAFMARLGRQLAAVDRLGREREAPPPSLERAARRLAERLGVRERIEVGVSSELSVPAVVGWRRPVILFPPAALEILSPAELDAVLVHELAHVHRSDGLVNLLQAAAEGVLFWHPAVWWISHRARVEREYCCDDVAVRQTSGGVMPYLRALLDLEAARACAPRPAPAHALGIARGRLLDRAVRLSLAPEPASRLRWLAPAGLAAAMGLAAAFALAAFAAEVSAWAIMERDLSERTPAASAVLSAPPPVAGNSARVGSQNQAPQLLRSRAAG